MYSLVQRLRALFASRCKEVSKKNQVATRCATLHDIANVHGCRYIGVYSGIGQDLQQRAFTDMKSDPEQCIRCCIPTLKTLISGCVHASEIQQAATLTERVFS